MSLHRRNHRQLTLQRQTEDFEVGKPGSALLNRQQCLFGPAAAEIAAKPGEHDHFVSALSTDVLERFAHSVQKGFRE